MTTTTKINGCTVTVTTKINGSVRVSASHDSGCGPSVSKTVKAASVDAAIRSCSLLARYNAGM